MTNDQREELGHYEQGQQAVNLLWSRWRERPEVDDPRDPEFASGALDEIIRRLVNSDDVDKEIREFSEAAAEQVTKANRTIYEILQNADDLGAKYLRFSLRRRGQGELLAVHDGKLVEAAHVIAMTLAFLSLKRADARSKGRFGIGLKTLNQIGSKLSVHCPPYHFSVERGMLQSIEPVQAIRGLFDPSQNETLLIVNLDGEYEVDDVQEWIHAIDASHLLFLDTVRTLTLSDARAGKAQWSTSIKAEPFEKPEIELRPGVSYWAERVLLTDQTKRGRSWVRYSIDYRVPDGQRRAHKATAPTTPLSVAISDQSEPGILAAGLPLDFPNSLPVSLNAQFDPDLARRGVLNHRWNKWLFDRLADLVSGVALLRFNQDVRTGWQAVPLNEEISGDEVWTESRISRLVETVHERVRSRVRLKIDGDAFRLGDFTYLSAGLDKFISGDDQRLLSPDHIPLPKQYCDRRHRWRLVLDALGEGHRIDAEDALKLLDLSDEELGARSVGWFIALADAALAAGLDDALASARSVVAEDGSRHCPEGELMFVRDVDHESIPSRLGLAKRLAPEYFSTSTPNRVRGWIEKFCVVSTSANPISVITALSRRSGDEPQHVDDEVLLILKDALQKADDVHRPSLAAAIGGAISIDGYEYRRGKKSSLTVRPALAYLPTPIAKDTGGWAAAAKTTEGLFWIDPRYGPLLRTGPASELSARRFFLLLGAKAGPRLIRRAGAANVPIEVEIPAAQDDALRALSSDRRPDSLQNDFQSPDLERVIADIVRQPVNDKRRQRSRALFETLVRNWDHYLAEHAEANATYFFYTRRHAGSIPATWLAHAASEPWLSSKSKRKVAPREIAIETATTRLTRGKKSSQYVYELTEADSGFPLVPALEIKGTPPASELIAELRGLKEKFGAKAWLDDVRPLYSALAALISGERAQRVGDLSTSDLRHSFESHDLLLTGLGWRPPSNVYRGRAIFGRRRAFVLEQRQLVPLWQLLHVTEPSIADCFEVMEQIAAAGSAPDHEDQGIIVDVLRRLAEQEGAARGRNARRMARLPLWTSRGWQTERPLYAVFDRSLEEFLGEDLPLWLPGCSLQSLASLPQLLGVQIVTDTDFSISPDLDVEAADELTVHTFRAAIRRLRDELGRRSQGLWDAVDWAQLENVELLIAQPLTADIKIPGRRLSIPRTVHVEAMRRLYFTDAEELGRPESGERILAAFVSGALPQMIDFAWSHAWREAEDSGAPEIELILAQRPDEDGADPLQDLATKGKRAAGKRLFAGSALTSENRRGKRKSAPAPKPRRLKTFEAATIADVTIVGPDKKPKHVKSARRPLIVDPTSIRLPRDADPVPSPVKQWSEKERERSGFEVLAAALEQIGDLQLGDFSTLRGIGADSIDNLKRFFELKAFAGDAPDEVRLEASEFERAVKAGKDYFLAVVSGLEEGKETQIRIFADPARTLTWRRNSRIRLGGIRSGTSPGLLVPIVTPEE